MSAGVRVTIDCEGALARAVMAATRLAAEVGLGAIDRQRVATAVSELARNVLRYAVRGEVHLRAVEGAGGRRGVELEVRDEGPGIADPEAAMQDHVSSTDSLGLGLPGVRRLMDEFELRTAVGRGTVVRATKWK